MTPTSAVVRAADLAADRYAVARAALAELPLAVVLLGAAHGETRSCATGTAMYVSFAPPRIAIALHPGSTTCRLVAASGAFSVSVLRVDQQGVAVGAGHGVPGSDKFAALGLPTRETQELPGVPALADAAFVAWCRVTDQLPTGDHLVFVGEVTAFAPMADDASQPPLMRRRRRYAALGEYLGDEAAEGYPT